MIPVHRPAERRAARGDEYRRTDESLAAQEREARFRKLLESLSDPAQIKAIEPEKDEKLGTLQASLTKVIEGDHRGAHMAVKRGVIYVSLSPIPGARRSGGLRA